MSITVEDVSFDYGAKRALDGVSLRVAEGRFCALLGPNGAGKSTLFALLTGLLSVPHGRVALAGHDMTTEPRAALARLGVVFQSPTLDLDLTVAQNLKYFAALHGIRGAAAQARIDTALTRLEMAERSGEKVRALNGGHRRRTEIARALVHDPRVLLLDEPTVGLDAAARAAITDHVHALSERDGITVLWATHLTDEVRPGDDLAVLHQGRIRARGTASEIAGDRPLTEVFLDLTGVAA